MLGSLWRSAALAAVLAATVAPAAHAATITRVTPQGEVAQARQLVVAFDEAVVPLGDARQTAPVALACEGGTPAGSGRWADERTWVLDFTEALPPGLRCSVRAVPGWTPQRGTLTGRTEFGFSTGGPSVVGTTPYPGSRIEEDQHFLLRLSGPVLASSLAGRAWCEVDGIGDRIPVRVVTGAPRDELIRERRLQKDAARLLLLACERPLPNEVGMRLIWGAGIAAQRNPALVTREPQRFDYTVRRSFVAEFSCERERAGAPCVPVRPLRLGFSEPIPRAAAQQVRLVPAAGAASGAALAPEFDADERDAEVSELRFPVPLAENARFTITLPPGLKDGAGRLLANAASFPLAVATGAAPPIAKFAAAPFGILERSDPVLPVTLRHVQGDLRPAANGGQVRVRRVDSPADILAWYARLRRHHESQISAQDAGLPRDRWTEMQAHTDARGKTVKRPVPRFVATRELSLLKDDAAAKRLDLPALQGGDPRPFEVVGIPLAEPGFHVVEIASQRLGAALLKDPAPMYVRTGALVTNLGLHFKHGRADSLAWVTTLDRGRPVPGAEVTVHDCNGQALWSGATGADGLARIPRALDEGRARCVADEGLFVTARKAEAGGTADIAFVFSSWQRGIEPWRFDLPTATGAEPDVRAHTVFDRTLLRAGETVSMKHFIRLETSAGLAPLAPEALPTLLKIVHDGSGQEFTQPLAWAGARHALSTWTIPPAARLGAYRVVLQRGDGNERREWSAGDFRVEAFRVPLLDARLTPPTAPAVAPKELALALQMNYLSGGPVAGAAVSASALLRPRALDFAGFEGTSFAPPRAAERGDGDGSEPVGEGRLVADKLALATDAQGAARVLLPGLPPLTQPSELRVEASFADPNGETQTVATSVPLWPSAVVLGVKTTSWVSRRGQVAFSVVALDTAGRPLKGQAVEVRGRVARTISTRKRLVGGFYAYDNRTEFDDLGVLCSGRSDATGRLDCEAKLDSAGEVELIASATDAAGRAAVAAASVWVTGQGELWFAQDNDDRIELLPEKRELEPGETARLQVRLPFRLATALVAVEREGIVETRIVTLRGDDPTVELTVQPGWGPNVYVSVLAVRGRVRDVSWRSFFAWGWKEPLDWARSVWYEGRQYQAPTAMVDLSRPSFKLGVAALRVGRGAHALQVSVTPDKPQYGVRETATARIRVTQGGQPAAGALVAFAAVDEGLLALRDNGSWQLLEGLVRERAWGVQTSTAHGEIVGRRHYGRKAVAAGGGGGRGGTRELFDTLLSWQPVVRLDAKGEAVVQVPLNDSLTSFRFVAVADAGDRFGTGSASIRVTQDLQLLSGLPPLVRDGDRFQALLTLRNTTARTMSLRATLAGQAGSTAITLPAQTLSLPAGQARELSWPVEVPEGAGSIVWTASVDEQGAALAAGAKDRLRITQAVQDAVPLQVQQATLLQVAARVSLPVAAPADALPAQGAKRGGLDLSLMPTLAGALPGVRRYFETYPYTCLEQQASKAIALGDRAGWAALAETLPTYLDADGLANYFPPREDEAARGSDRLTAHLLAAASDAGFELPPAVREAMLGGLAAFVEGRIERRFWAPQADLEVRKLAALAALARHGRVLPSMLGSLQITPNRWPTAAVVDWLTLLQRVDGVPQRERRRAEALNILRARLTTSGTLLRLANEDADFWWWLMDSPDSNAARLVLAVVDEAGWQADMPRLVRGLLARQRGGAWLTTTANLWGVLALNRFAAKFESTPVAGQTTAAVGSEAMTLDWSLQGAGGRLAMPWPDAAGMPASTLTVTHQGSGQPWLSVQALAAVPLQAPQRAGYGLTRTLSAVQQKTPGAWSRGDLLRVRVEIEALADMSWVVLSDPVPGGATVLGGGGSGLGRDSAIATRGEGPDGRDGSASPAYVERGFDQFRSTFEFLPRGRHVVDYTLRLNNPGRFSLPPTRVEAMYAPETFGALPNAPIEVAP